MSDTATELSSTQISMINEAEARRSRNLKFFKEFHPPIYKKFSEFKLKNYRVSFNTKINQFDLLLNGKSIYGDAPVAYAKEEINDFYKKFSKNKRLRTVPPPFSGYILPRMFHKKCTELIESSPIKQQDYKGYIIPDFYPAIVFHGVGAGYHIEEFLTKNNVINCMVVEPHPELFAASLYIVDWEKICRPFMDDKNKVIHFIIGPFEDENRLIGYVFKFLTTHCPIYPLTTLFINHKGLDIYTRLTKQINEDTHAFTSIWGHYDDEIYQLNSCLHNLYSSYNIIKPNLVELLDLPVIIVGGGPSLNDRIEQIKSFKDKALIVSCGTSIHSLYHFNIKPDIHVELESHLVTVTALEELNDPEWLKGIPIIGPTQLPPRVFQFFDKKAMYFKGESVTSFLFGNQDSSVARGTPTCSNAALALFLHWGFKDIYLFGIDMGYKDTAVHHANGSVYYKTKDKELSTGANVVTAATISIDAVGGGKIKTQPLLYTAKRTIETCASVYKKTSKVYNCSDGAELKNTYWLSQNDMQLEISEDKALSLKSIFHNHQFVNNENIIDKEKIEDRISVLTHNIEEITRYVSEEIGSIEDDLYSLTITVNNIAVFLENMIKPKIPPFYFFIRGSIWHLLYIGYSHALSIEDETIRKEWIANWRNKSITTLSEINQHFKKIIEKEYDLKTDHWIWTSPSEPE